MKSLKYEIGAIVLALAATWPCAHGAVIAGPLTNSANGHVYYLLNALGDPKLAEAEAIHLGGHLVTINDAAEQQWVYGTFSPLSGTHRVYIGLRDFDGDGPATFTWMSGAPVTYTHWAPGSPDHNAGNTNGLQDFVVMYPTNGANAGYWDDRAAWEQGTSPYAIVEVNPFVVLSISRIGNSVDIAWLTETSNTYRLQWSGSLGTNQWTDLGSPIIGNGATNHSLDSVQSAGRRFYRVVR